MARKQPVGYEVRRPLTLWGRKRDIGEYLPAKEVASMPRIESMIRSGRFVEVFEDPKVKTAVRRGRPRKAVAADHATKPVKKSKGKKVDPKPADEVPDVVVEPYVPVMGEPEGE